MNTLPTPAVSKVLLVNVSVVAFPTRVSVAVGKVRIFDTSAPVFGDNVIVPLVPLANAKEPPTLPAVPNVGVDVNDGGVPPIRTFPVTPAKVDVGVPPAPPPITTPFNVNSPEAVRDAGPLKNGMPPLVPATVIDRAQLEVHGDPEIENIEDGTDSEKLVIVPFELFHTW